MKHFYGYKPDPVDSRDLYLEVEAKNLPFSVDLRGLCSPVRDQGELGSCTAFAMATGLREFMLNAAYSPLSVLSPLFLYYKERALEHTVGEDSGAYIRDGLKVLAKTGVCLESLWPYNIGKFAQTPAAKENTNAKLFKIASYARVSSLKGVKTALSQGKGVVLGFTVYESFESDVVAQTGVMPMPQPGEQVLGGHAVFCVGYDDGRQWLIVKNSWGSGWGDKGYFYMPYGYVTTANVSDMWVAQ